jgi:Asp/Glu/hydantoin racemase
MQRLSRMVAAALARMRRSRTYQFLWRLYRRLRRRTYGLVRPILGVTAIVVAVLGLAGLGSLRDRAAQTAMTNLAASIGEHLDTAARRLAESSTTLDNRSLATALDDVREATYTVTEAAAEGVALVQEDARARGALEASRIAADADIATKEADAAATGMVTLSQLQDLRKSPGPADVKAGDGVSSAQAGLQWPFEQVQQHVQESIRASKLLVSTINRDPSSNSGAPSARNSTQSPARAGGSYIFDGFFDHNAPLNVLYPMAVGAMALVAIGGATVLLLLFFALIGFKWDSKSLALRGVGGAAAHQVTRLATAAAPLLP